jgi:NitT/TauT family transport system permease protein
VRSRLADRSIAFFAFVLAWSALAVVYARTIPTPYAVASRLAELARHGLLDHASVTLGEAVAGFVLGAVPAIAIPILLRPWPSVFEVLRPFLAAAYGAPKVALAPLLVVWFGIGVGSKVVLVTLLVFFIVFFMTLGGVEAVSKSLVSTARVLGANDRRIARDIVWPSVRPYAITGLRIAAPQAIGAAVVGEIISSNRGLGFTIQAAAADFDAAGVFAGTFVLAAFVALVNLGFDAAERRGHAWRRGVPSDESSSTF